MSVLFEGYEIPICKKYCKMSEGKHFHCPKCNRVCKERSVTVNHVWRCLQAEKGPAEDDPVDLDDAEDYELEESLLKVGVSNTVYSEIFARVLFS